ncbi:GNAT family N-acetyltransferase [Bailinhaonella thermotolerans]|uniref:GNAT family N-acetyltransferase n=1 Tax=Bailinhaonella thermotolerans TaxID=1070861 RepID=A0A3A4B006_9ACTN|nr:GNAT family N-acetyltransferase [Bailinhaonella thermotolerans]RJL34169.1 GNAT family N-acetyltransferase [Bailinhaonella thermotolerans]
MEITLTAEPPGSPVILGLCAAQQAELAGRYAEEHTPLAVHPGIRFVVAWAGRDPAGCAGLQLLEPGVGELKRMYVVPGHRGRGLSRLLLAEVERLAREDGLREIRLETGDRQPEAIALYTSSGYREIPRFGPYEDWPLSHCFAKAL